MDTETKIDSQHQCARRKVCARPTKSDHTDMPCIAIKHTKMWKVITVVRPLSAIDVRMNVNTELELTNDPHMHHTQKNGNACTFWPMHKCAMSGMYAFSLTHRDKASRLIVLIRILFLQGDSWQRPLRRRNEWWYTYAVQHLNVVPRSLERRTRQRQITHTWRNRTKSQFGPVAQKIDSALSLRRSESI